MNYLQLRAAVIADTHKSYDDDTIKRFIAQGESLIASKLEHYSSEFTFTDADRGGDVTANVYTFTGFITLVRYVSYNGMPLDQVDENLIWLNRSNNNPVMYAVRPFGMIVAGTPPAGANLVMQYFGMPVQLANDADTNTLLTFYPQTYIAAAAYYIYQRAQDYESADRALQDLGFLISEVNRKSKKKLGGARAAPVYNTDFRSSY